MSTQLSFAVFKAGAPARDMFRKLDLLDYLESAQRWRSLRRMIVDFNDCDAGHFVALVRECDGVASSGERVLLHAICFATDFAWLADELTAGKAWQRMDRASGDHLRAVAACILAAEA